MAKPKKVATVSKRNIWDIRSDLALEFAKQWYSASFQEIVCEGKSTSLSIDKAKAFDKLASLFCSGMTAVDEPVGNDFDAYGIEFDAAAAIETLSAPVVTLLNYSFIEGKNYNNYLAWVSFAKDYLNCHLSFNVRTEVAPHFNVNAYTNDMITNATLEATKEIESALAAAWEHFENM